MEKLLEFLQVRRLLTNISILTCQSCAFTAPKHQQRKDAREHHLEISSDPYLNEE